MSTAPLSSYVSGAWHVPDDEGTPLHDAVTGADDSPRADTNAGPQPGSGPQGDAVPQGDDAPVSGR